jgi:hypothetical protein
VKKVVLVIGLVMPLAATFICRLTGAAGFSVAYEGTCGYPTHRSFDPRRNTLDDERWFASTSFEPAF